MTIANRVAYLLSSGVEPSCLLIVTLTNRAVSELRDRIRKIVGTELASVLKITTVHGYCQDIILKNLPAIGLDQAPIIASDLDRKICKEVSIGCGKFSY